MTNFDLTKPTDTEKKNAQCDQDVVCPILSTITNNPNPRKTSMEKDNNNNNNMDDRQHRDNFIHNGMMFLKEKKN